MPGRRTSIPYVTLPSTRRGVSRNWVGLFIRVNWSGVLILAEVAIGGRVFRAHLGPVAFKLFADHLRTGSKCRLPHFALGNTDGHRIVVRDDEPRVDLGLAPTLERYTRLVGNLCN